MVFSERERERIREEELVRLQVREEMKLRQRPQLLLWGALWTAVLAAPALISPHIH
jgi:hypothetical protein